MLNNAGGARRPKLRTLLLLVNLVLLALPLGGIALLRIYESALVRQTESELIAQGAFIAASYRAAFSRLSAEFGRPAAALAHYGLPLPATPNAEPDSPWRPRPPSLDLASDPVLAPRPEPRQAPHPADPLALTIGRELGPVLREAQRTTLAGMRLLDYRGVVVGSTGYDSGRSLAHLQEVRRALAGEAVSLLRARELDQPPPALNSISRGALIRAVVASPIVRDDRIIGAVLLARTPNTIVRALYGKRYLLAWFGLGLLAIALLLSLFTSYTISRPLAALVHQVERAARGEKGAVTPLAQPVTAEVDRLSRSVAEMAGALEQRADYIRGFAAHVSHEFKTPLAAMRGALELLQDHYHTMTQPERERFLHNLQRDVDRLERLVRRLLELARADVMRAGTTACSADAVVCRTAARYRADGLRVDVAPVEQPLRVAMAADTLEAILVNMLDNARQHTGGDAAASLRLQPPGSDGLVGLIVSDNGPGVSAANTGKVFQPFFTTARDHGGTGLGLAIVRALLAAHGGDIELLDGPGARFRLRFKAVITDLPDRSG